MFNQLQRAINLSQKTGDKLIVFDSRNPESSYVLIPFDEYERSFYETCECCCDDECCMPEEMENEDYFDDKDFFEKNEINSSEENVDFDSNLDSDIADSRDINEYSDDYFSTRDSHLTEEDQIDKINRDLSMSVDADLQNENVFNEMSFLEGNFDNRADKSEDRPGRRNNWNIPGNIKASAEEVIEEDRHYLEEITF